MNKIRTKFLVTMGILVIPVVVILVTYIGYSYSVLNKNVAESYRSASYLYENPLTNDLQSIQSYLINELANSSDMVRLNYDLTSLQAYVCGQEILVDFSKMLATNMEGLTALAFRSENNDIMRIAYKSGVTYSDPEKTHIRDIATDEMKKSESIEKGWYHVSSDQNNFLVRVLKYGNVSICAVIDFNYIMKPQNENEKSQSAYMVYVTEEGQVLDDGTYLVENHITLKSGNDKFYITGKNNERFMVVYHKLKEVNLIQYYINPYAGIWIYTDTLQKILIVLFFIYITLIPLSYRYMNRALIIPLENLKQTMGEISEGQIQVRAKEDYDTEEVNTVAKTFNKMMAQIQQLKIDKYENEKQIQNAQIQYLQIQIRPHFFLNCLKNFYALAEERKYDQIQEMTLALSKYLRKMFTRDEQMVNIRDEIESVEYYLNLSRMSFSRNILSNFEVDESLESFMIPPLTILTYVENAIKYGIKIDGDLLLSIKVKKLGEGADSYLCITVLDNGRGFDETTLMLLNSDQYVVEEKEHIGLLNIKKRLILTYGNKASIFYSNFNGACIEIYIPYEENK